MTSTLGTNGSIDSNNVQDPSKDRNRSVESDLVVGSDPSSSNEESASNDGLNDTDEEDYEKASTEIKDSKPLL